MFNRRPGGLPDIMQTLQSRNKLAFRDQILKGDFYKKEAPKSTLGWLASGLYSNTVGYMFKEPE